MCDEILVAKDGKHTACENMGELIAATGLDVTTLFPESGGICDPIECLCNVDAEVLGGRVATADEGWPWVLYVIDDAALKALGVE